MIPIRGRDEGFIEGEDRRQATLLPDSLEDYVTEDNPVRVVDVFIGELDLEALGFSGVVPEMTGMRESGQSWKELLVDLKARGLSIAPDIAVGDGALGFWKALDEAFPSTRHQRCWRHKTLNVLDKLPKSVQPNAHRDLREIWLSENRAVADAAMTTFAEKYAPKYDCDCMDAA